MQVGIDITSLIYGRGVSRYTSNLVSALSDYNLNLSLFGYSWQKYSWLKNQANDLASYNNKTQIKISHIPPKLLEHAWKIGLKPMASFFPNLDVFHSWDWLQPPDNHLPLVSTIHDLSMLKFPDTVHPSILSHHQKSWQILKDRQARIIAVSRSTKKDIVDLLGIPAYLVHVVYEALPVEINYLSQAISEDEYNKIKLDLKLERPFIFFVGTREPRKNLERLIHAWEPLSHDFDLIIAGDAGWDNTSNRENFQHLSEKGLRFLGRVNDHQLFVLYSQANVFAFPSLYEGFGLPILEAFHHGTPVVTSNNSGMMEISGNAAELVDPSSVEDIRRGLTTVLGENLVQQRIRLQRMIIRKQLFSWKKAASETIKV
jgi:glycosyltransferase involved in cell wall biosynthesis